MSSSVDFMDNLQGELNRRLAVLAVLYYQRRTNPYNPEVSLADIEKRMGFPRDYLDFTTWYLVRKNYVSKADNSDFSLTAEGVDFVETQRIRIPVLNKLLTNGTEAAAASAAAADIAEAASHASEPPEPIEARESGPDIGITGGPDVAAPTVKRPAAKIPQPTPGTALEVTTTPAHRKAASRGPVIPGLASITISEMIPAPSPAVANIEKFVMVGKALFKERRHTSKERRSGTPDTRAQKVERRQNNRDRRSR